MSSSASAAAPTITGWDDATTRKGTGIAILDTNVMIADSDSPNFNAGTLTARMVVAGAVGSIPASTATIKDRLTILHQGSAAGQIGVVDPDLTSTTNTNRNITYGGVLIGTTAAIDVTNATVLTVALNSNATPAAVQALARRIAYQNTDATLLGNRRVRVQVSDATPAVATLSNAPDKLITIVQQAPTIGAASDVYYRAWNDNNYVLLDADITLTDPDSLNFGSGYVKVTLPTGATSLQSLSLLNQGTAAGQIGVSGTSVSYGGVVIGTWGGVAVTATNPLQVNLNTSATPAAVQALLRRIAYRSAKTTAPTGTSEKQLVSISVSDGDGGIGSVSKSVFLGKYEGAYAGKLTGAALPGGLINVTFTGTPVAANPTASPPVPPSVSTAISFGSPSGTGTGTINVFTGAFHSSSSPATVTTTLNGVTTTVNLYGVSKLNADGTATLSGTWSYVHAGTTYTGAFTAKRP